MIERQINRLYRSGKLILSTCQCIRFRTSSQCSETRCEVQKFISYTVFTVIMQLSFFEFFSFF